MWGNNLGPRDPLCVLHDGQCQSFGVRLSVCLTVRKAQGHTSPGTMRRQWVCHGGRDDGI